MQKLLKTSNQTKNLFSKSQQILNSKIWRHLSNDPEFNFQKLPKNADVIIAGGGVIACSIAYHLANQGVSNVLVLEKEKSVYFKTIYKTLSKNHN